jgi:hypothetical protein
MSSIDYNLYLLIDFSFGSPPAKVLTDTLLVEVKDIETAFILDNVHLMT